MTTTETLVDGSIIAENPSLYSSVLAMETYNEEKVRVVSLGTGISDFSDLKFTSGEFIQRLLGDSERIIEFFDYVKATAHQFLTKYMVQPENYHYFNFESGEYLSDYTGQHMSEVIEMGNNLLKRNKDKIEKLIQTIVDEKF